MSIKREKELISELTDVKSLLMSENFASGATYSQRPRPDDGRKNTILKKIHSGFQNLFCSVGWCC